MLQLQSYSVIISTIVCHLLGSNQLITTLSTNSILKKASLIFYFFFKSINIWIVRGAYKLSTVWPVGCWSRRFAINTSVIDPAAVDSWILSSVLFICIQMNRKQTELMTTAVSWCWVCSRWKNKVSWQWLHSGDVYAINSRHGDRWPVINYRTSIIISYHWLVPLLPNTTQCHRQYHTVTSNLPNVHLPHSLLE